VRQKYSNAQVEVVTVMPFKFVTNIVRTVGVVLVSGAFFFAKPQSLSGTWVDADHPLADGTTYYIYFHLAQHDDNVTGKIYYPWGLRTIIGGEVLHGHFQLIDSTNTVAFEGDLIDGTLHLRSLVGPYKNLERTATRGEDSEIPTLPAVIPLPSLRPVPKNGLALSPPMGWNSWNLFADKVDDQTVRTMADAMVSSGMRDAGYVYVNIDDTWEGLRDANGHLASNAKFPDMKALADYVHARGLKLGIYSSPGPRTCMGYAGSYGHEAEDAQIFAKWGVDFLKYDWCSAGLIYHPGDARGVYQKMGEALEAAGRPIVYSLGGGGTGGVERWAPAVGANLWRTTSDIRDDWASMIGNIEKQVYTMPYGGPGHWNDPDMLEIGNGHMTDDEYRTHMSLWALSAAPLLAGNDLRNMTEQTEAILMNREVIAIDQDPLGRQATPQKSGDMERWSKPLADGSVAVGVVNLGSDSASVTILVSSLGLNGPVISARDLWAHRNVKFKDGQFTGTVPAHGILLLRVTTQ
jgi:alpha-galactosidase